MKSTIIALLLLVFSLGAYAQANTAAAKKFIQITLKKSGGNYAIKVPNDQGFAVGGLSPNAFESRFNGMQSLPPLLEFMDQNGYRMTHHIERRGWGLFFHPGSHVIMVFERK